MSSMSSMKDEEVKTILRKVTELEENLRIAESKLHLISISISIDFTICGNVSGHFLTASYLL